MVSAEQAKANQDAARDRFRAGVSPETFDFQNISNFINTARVLKTNKRSKGILCNELGEIREALVLL